MGAYLLKGKSKLIGFISCLLLAVSGSQGSAPASALTSPKISISFPSKPVTQGKFGIIAIGTNTSTSDYSPVSVDLVVCRFTNSCSTRKNLTFNYGDTSEGSEFVNSEIAVVAQDEKLFLVEALQSGTYQFRFNYHYKLDNADTCQSAVNACVERSIEVQSSFDVSKSIAADVRFIPSYLYSNGISMIGNFGLACSTRVTSKTLTCSVKPTAFMYVPNTDYTNGYDLPLKGNLKIQFQVVHENYHTRMYVYNKTVAIGKTSQRFTMTNPKWYLYEWRPYVQVLPRAIQDGMSPGTWFKRDTFWKAGRWY